MREENIKMREYLKQNGIEAMPKFIWTGSIKGCWRLYNHDLMWWDNTALQEKLKALGFVDFDNKPLSNYSSNGSVFSVFVRHPQLTKQFIGG